MTPACIKLIKTQRAPQIREKLGPLTYWPALSIPAHFAFYFETECHKINHVALELVSFLSQSLKQVGGPAHAFFGPGQP